MICFNCGHNNFFKIKRHGGFSNINLPCFNLCAGSGVEISCWRSMRAARTSRRKKTPLLRLFRRRYSYTDTFCDFQHRMWLSDKKDFSDSVRPPRVKPQKPDRKDRHLTKFFRPTILSRKAQDSESPCLRSGRRVFRMPRRSVRRGPLLRFYQEIFKKGLENESK